MLANDDDADGDHLTATLVDGGGNGSLSLAGDGGFTFKSGGSLHGDSDLHVSGVRRPRRVVDDDGDDHRDGKGPDTDADAGPDTHPDSAADPDPDAHAQPDPSADGHPDTQADLAAADRAATNVAATDAAATHDSDPDPVAERVPGCDGRPDAHTQPGTDRDAQSDAHAVGDRDAQPDADAERDPESDPDRSAGRRHHPARPDRLRSCALGHRRLDARWTRLVPVAAPIFVVPAADDPGTIVMDAGGMSFAGFDWAVPALVLTVPGLILVLAVGAQALAGIVLLRMARRSMESDRRRRRA